MSENTDKRTATQRLEDLEKVVASLYEEATRNIGLVNSLLKSQSELKMIKDAIKLLNHKSEAIVMSAMEASGISNDSVNNNMIKLNVLDLQKQVEISVNSGNLVATDVVADGTYVVCEEVNADGTVANPRVQFPLAAQPSEVQELLKGKKVGDLVTFGQPGSLDAKILEIYTLVDVEKAKAEAAAQAAAAAAATPVESAPAAETTATDTAETAAPEAATESTQATA
jgi:hypothetical protein